MERISFSVQMTKVRTTGVSLSWLCLGKKQLNTLRLLHIVSELTLDICRFVKLGVNKSRKTVKDADSESLVYFMNTMKHFTVHRAK